MNTVTDFTTTQIGREKHDDLQDERARQWLEEHMGGKVLSMVHHLRWRPTWVVEMEVDGEYKKLFVRGPRGEEWINPVSMRQEADIHAVLERNGVPVAHIYHELEDAWAIVMDAVTGQIIIGTARDDRARDAVSQQFVEALVRVHRIPLADFAEIGLHIPEDPSDIALNHYRRCYDIFRRQMGDEVVPFMDFTWHWLVRNVPEYRHRGCGITGDAGQFMFDGDRLVCLIDFEQFYVGDPIADFSAMRLRDMIEPLDIADLIRRYEGLAGEPVDKYAFEYHTVGFNGVNGWLLWPTTVSPDLEQDYVAYLSFAIASSRWTVKSMVEIMGIELEDVPLPEESRPFAPMPPFAHLMDSIPKLKGQGRYAEYNEMKTASLAKYIDRWNRYGNWVIKQDLENVSKLLGKTCNDYRQAQRELSAFVAEVGADHDETLIQYFHRWLEMQEFLVRDCGPQTFLVGRDLKPIELPWRPGTAPEVRTTEE